MRSIADANQLSRLFTAYTEHALIDELGVADTRLVDYLSGLLIRFVHHDSIFSMRGQGHRFMAIAEMVDHIERSECVGSQRRELFRHIGDFALFWTGVFPEAVQRPQRRTSAGFREYTEQGKHSYLVASTYCDTPEQADESPVLRRLSSEFEVCAVGLRRARDLWEGDQLSLESDGFSGPG